MLLDITSPGVGTGKQEPGLAGVASVKGTHAVAYIGVPSRRNVAGE